MGTNVTTAARVVQKHRSFPALIEDNFDITIFDCLQRKVYIFVCVIDEQRRNSLDDVCETPLLPLLPLKSIKISQESANMFLFLSLLP